MTLQNLSATETQIPDGPEGIKDTLNLMRGYVKQYKKDLRIRDLAANLVKPIQPKSWLQEIAACFDYVRDEIRYTQDIEGVETLQTPIATLELGYGDCDDMCTLLAAMLGSIGHPTRFVAIAFEPNNFTHVFLQAQVADAYTWIALDPTESYPIGWKPPGFIAWMIRDN